jgi:hypothetical protein
MCYADGDPDLFTVALEHSGFFSGLVDNLQYIDGSEHYFDNCNVDTFSVLWIEDFLKQLGHEITASVHVYWCFPGKDIRDGLRLIEKDADILAMTEAAKEHKTLCLWVDHTNFLKTLRDDAIPNGGPKLRHVINTREVPNIFAQSEGTSGSKCADEGEETDPEFYDSDYDAEDGDDDIFDANVDKDVNENNEHMDVNVKEDDATLEDEDLNMTKEQEAELKYKFNVFNPEVDLDRPEFKVGMVFSSMREIRNALSAYSIRNRVKVSKIRNEATRIDAICRPGCPWLLKASEDSRTEAIIVRTYEPKHTCERVWELKALTSTFLSRYFIDEFRDNQKMDLKTFAKKIRREFNMCPDRWKLGRARKNALQQIHGDEAVQFSLLWDYGQELRRSNPGSKFFLSTNKIKEQADDVPKEHLATLYWSYDACKRGFLQGCRPLICLDGCHIKTRYKGQLLTAVGIDPNDCIYPIAMGLVEVECTSSWEWFLTTLRDDLNITNTAPFTLMSDKQKV